MNKLQDIQNKVIKVSEKLHGAQIHARTAQEMMENLIEELTQMEKEMEAEYLAKKIREEQESGIPGDVKHSQKEE